MPAGERDESMTTKTLPQPVLSGWTWDYTGKKNRSLKAFFPLSEVVESPGLSGGTKTEQKGVEVVVHHHQSSKVFTATAYEMTKGQDGIFQTGFYSPMDGVGFLTVKVARYSDKALEAAFGAAMEMFPGVVESNEKVGGWFESKGEES